MLKKDITIPLYLHFLEMVKVSYKLQGKGNSRKKLIILNK